MDAGTEEALDNTDTIVNLDMNDKMPAEIKELIIDAFEKYCAKQREREQFEARRRWARQTEWKVYNKTVRELLPLCLREFMVEKEDEDISPLTRPLMARIEVPGLAPIVVKINELISPEGFLIVSIPKRIHLNGFSTSKDQVNYCFPDHDHAQSFHMSDLGEALLFARRSALHFNELVEEVEVEKAEFAKMQAEREKENVDREARGPEPVYEATDETVNNAPPWLRESAR
jgi:hypothetical protein